MSLAALAVLAALLRPAAAQIIGFNYSACAPSGFEDPSLASGDDAYVCLSFNGKSTSVFKTKVDQFSALQIAGCESRLSMTSQNDLG